jgi:hypothetical protein
MKLHVEDKETFDYTMSPRDRGDWDRPDDAQAQLSRIFARMLGAGNRNVNAYYPLENICEDFQVVLGNDFDAKELAETLLQQEESMDKSSAQARFYDDPESDFCKYADEQEEKTNTYDIIDYGNLMDFQRYEDGSYSAVAPDIHKSLVRDVKEIQGYADEVWDEFSALDQEGRARWFRCYYQEIITEELHQKMLDNIMDDDFIRRYVSIYRVDCTRSEPFQYLVHALLWNQELQDYYWKLAEELPAVDEETAESEEESE